MKKTLLTAVLSCFAAATLLAQTPCTDRFKSNQFDSVMVTEGVQFGEADQVIDFAGPMYTPVIQRQKLYMDIYQPYGDTEVNRPMIILAFGGAFVFGTRTDAYMVELCIRYAKLGYVTASIDYRLSRELALAGTKLDPIVAPKAVAKGMHDMRAAIRYMRYTIEAEGNPYKINTKQIYTGGVSAGAFCALHAAYLDKQAEIPADLVDWAAENGGIEGLSGYGGYSSKPAGVISFSGALGDATWLEAGDVPIVSTHGTADAVVPYGSDSVTILLINYPVDGSSVIHEHADRVEVKNAFYTYHGAGHAMEATDVAYRDSGFAFTRDFMYEVVCDAMSSSVTEFGGATNARLFPNPSAGDIYIDSPINTTFNIYSLDGALVRSGELTVGKNKISTELDSGLYLFEYNGNRSRVQVIK